MKNLVYFSLFLVLLACQKLKPSEPAPEPFEEAIAPQLSTIGAPIVFELKDIEEKANSALKTVIYEDKSFEDKNEDNLKLKVSKADRITMHMTGNVLYYTVPIRLHAEIQIDKKKLGFKILKPQTVDLAVRMKFRSTVSIGSDWRLKTQTESLGYEWIEKPQAHLGKIKINISSTVEKILKKKMSMIEDKIDKIAHDAIKIDQIVKKIWISLQKSILINKKESKIWLRPIPKKIEAGQIYSDGEWVRIQLKLTTSAETLVGEEPKYETNSQLPPFRQIANPPDSCEVRLVSEIAYAEINQILGQKLKGKEIDIEGNKLIFKDLELFGNGKNLIGKIKIGGTISGTIYVKGQPFYDTLSQSLKVLNFDFDIRTEETLLGTADWLLHETAKEKIQEKLAFPLGATLDKVPDIIRKAIANSKVSEKIDLDLEKMQILPQKITVRPDHLQVLVHAKAKVGITLKKL